MKIEEIKTIVKMMSENDLTEFKIEAEQYNLCIKRGGESVQTIASVAPQVIQPVMQPASTAAPAAEAENAVPENTIDSPIVGTFYSSPSPDADIFVKVGDEVKPDTVVCIIEAMKVMNEIKAEKSGVITKILCENASPVEFGQPLFVIE